MSHQNLSLAVHLHMFYREMWPELRGYLENIGKYPYDLYITMVEDDASLKKSIKAFKPEAKIKVVENRGYDVGPFIDFLHQIDLNNYDLIMKIHTKGEKEQEADLMVHDFRINRKLWKKLLVENLLGSLRLFKKNISLFQKDQHLGMIGSRYLITEEIKSDIQFEVNNMLKMMGLKIPAKVEFIAGTMFMCRAKLMEPIKNQFKLTDFNLTDGNIKDGTKAHNVERLLGGIITAQGYKIKGCGCVLETQLFLQRLCHFLYINKITNSNHHLIKILRLPIYWRKVS